jgi:nucleotide-binding universal stress UspA family protein
VTRGRHFLPFAAFPGRTEVEDLGMASSLLLGRVAEAVLRRAPCPVLTIRVPAAPEAHVGEPAHA